MKIGIVGGAGFVGSKLSTFFAELGRDFTVYDKNLSGESYVDVTNVYSLDGLLGVDVLINLAAVHRDDVRPLSRYDDVNVQGAKNICEAASKHGINKIIFTSSVAIYGFAPADTDESGESNYFNDYGRTKYLAEQVYKAWQAEDPEVELLLL